MTKNLKISPSIHRIIEIVEATGGYFMALKEGAQHLKNASEAIKEQLTKNPRRTRAYLYAHNRLVNKLVTNGWQNAQYYNDMDLLINNRGND